jgi:hypothetical protein
VKKGSVAEQVSAVETSKSEREGTRESDEARLSSRPGDSSRKMRETDQLARCHSEKASVESPVKDRAWTKDDLREDLMLDSAVERPVTTRELWSA